MQEPGTYQTRIFDYGGVDRKSCLFFLRQSHILHDVNLTFMLAN